MIDGDTSNFALALQALAIGATVLYLRKQHESPPQKLHVDYGSMPPPPLPVKIIASLPKWIRFPLLIKSGAPKPPKDSIDVLGTNEVDPYEKWEILPGKIWGVNYTSLSSIKAAKAMEGIFGGKLKDKEARVIARAPEHMKKILKEDFERNEKKGEMSYEERAKEGGDQSQIMYIAKIKVGNDEDGLVLYNPVRLHPHMLEWISEKGKVKFIVSGSSFHTNHLPDTAKLFPDAKIICSSAADAKCQAVGMRPADYLYDLRRDEVKTMGKAYVGRGTLEDATDELKGQATLFHVRGDVLTQALFFLVHKHLLEIDLIYAMSDEATKELGADTNTSLRWVGFRVIKYSVFTDQEPPLGWKVPVYRCMFMDPTNLMSSAMSLNPPKPDGSSCLEMAESLRSIMKKLREPGVCEKTHSGHFYSNSLDGFCKLMDETWGWLDGKSLLE